MKIMPRYDPLEREGINALEKVMIKDFEWVFRGQLAVDVGIDVLVEESISGEPSGKFLAVQVKSGKGNYYDNGKNLIYYISGVHYYYWINLGLPIILVLYNPDNEYIYWQEVNKSTVEKTSKGWKLVIPKFQVMTFKSKNQLKKIIYSFKSKGGFWKQDLVLSNHDPFAYIDNIVKIKYLTDSINYKNQYLSDLNKYLTERNSKFFELVSQNLGKGDLEVEAVIDGLASLININSTRLFNETQIFSEINADSIIAYRYVLLQNYKLQGKSILEDMNLAIQDIENLIKAFDIGLDGIKQMLSTFERLPEMFESLKEAKTNLNLTLTLIITNFSDAKSLWSQFVKELKKHL